MRFMAILNRHGGTLRATDLDALSTHIRSRFEKAGHPVEIEIVEGEGIGKALARAVERPDIDAVLAGGGDGTISAAAGALMGTGKALAILPAGTMNLFARSLGIPLDLDAAVDAFASGATREVDIATANGQPFVHQFSIGLHARMVQLRERMEFGSRIGKMWASGRAALGAMMHPPSMAVELRMGDTSVLAQTRGIGVTNNLFGEGHLPYSETPDGGTLGVYVSSAANRFEVFLLFVNIAIGRWRDNAQVEIHETGKVEMRIVSRRHRRKCVIDGELCTLSPTTLIEIHPRALTVIVPAG